MQRDQYINSTQDGDRFEPKSSERLPIQCPKRDQAMQAMPSSEIAIRTSDAMYTQSWFPLLCASELPCSPAPSFAMVKVLPGACSRNALEKRRCVAKVLKPSC
jgi:hypothetical protein